MNIIKKRRACEQVRKFRARFAQSAGAVIGNVIPAASLQRWISAEVGPHRERIYGPLRTLTLFVEQVLSDDQSCQDAVARNVCEQVAAGQKPSSSNNGPYCDARKRLPLGLLSRMGREIGARLTQQQPVDWLWQGRQIKLVDGTTVSMPDTPENQAAFPQNRQQQSGLGFPVARLVAVISLSCGAVLEWVTSACEGKMTGETALLWGLSSHFKRGDVVIADRYYAGYFMIALMVSLGVDVIVRQHQTRTTDFRRGQRLGKRDHIVRWVRPKRPPWMDDATYQTMPDTLTIRETRTSEWTLATTLLDPAVATKGELFELYSLRWQVELDLRSIKDVMKMSVLRCKHPEMVRKEIAAHLVAYNLVRAVMAQSAHLGETLPSKLSFKGALQLLRAFEENISRCPRRRQSICHCYLLTCIAQLKLPVRPGRVEPRLIKRRKNQRLLTQPRQKLRADLLRQKEKYVAASLS
jgi:hypothetical protein